MYILNVPLNEESLYINIYVTLNRKLFQNLIIDYLINLKLNI